MISLQPHLTLLLINLDLLQHHKLILKRRPPLLPLLILHPHLIPPIHHPLRIIHNPILHPLLHPLPLKHIHLRLRMRRHQTVRKLILRLPLLLLIIDQQRSILRRLHVGSLLLPVLLILLVPEFGKEFRVDAEGFVLEFLGEIGDQFEFSLLRELGFGVGHYADCAGSEQDFFSFFQSVQAAFEVPCDTLVFLKAFQVLSPTSIFQVGQSERIWVFQVA